MPVLAELRHDEGVCLNPDPLIAIYSELGEAGAERLIGRALEEVATRVDEIRFCAERGRTHQLLRSGRLLARVAEQIGMATFAKVARDLVAATERAEPVAQAAILARLLRIAERSLNAIWDIQGADV